jgi:hypothetical protein
MDKFTVRRKIIRGSLSAPVILTVASPASLAAASTTCLVNTNQAETARPPLFQPETTDDGYLRRTIDVCQFKDSNGNVIDDYFYVDKNGFWRSMSSGNSFAASGTPTCSEKREVLVYVDAQGQETWYGWPSSTAGGSFTSIGCWHSLLIRP